MNESWTEWQALCFCLVILAAMLFCHVVDDYYLQGILASMKQKAWWRENAPGTLYENDYRMALAEHAFSWSFVMSLPLLAITLWRQSMPLMAFLLISYPINTVVHALVDNTKANKRKINLITDQCIHFLQIFFTWWVAIMLMP